MTPVMNMYRLLVDFHEVMCRKLAEQPQPDVPVHVMDQFEAAQAESIDAIEGYVSEAEEIIGEPMKWATVTDADERADALVIAAFSLPWMRPCPHVSSVGPRPLLAQLPAMVVVCRECAMWMSSAPDTGDADRCDFCGRRGVDAFVPVMLRAGWFTAAGDACDECFELTQSPFAEH